MLYPNGKKEYTRQVLDLLDAQGLAIWFMDDGCIDRPVDKNPMGILNTCGHKPNGEEEVVIQKYFEEVWNIKVSLNKNHGRYRIRMSNPEFKKFIEIIKPYIIPSLLYKIDTTIRQKDPAMPK